MYTDSPTSHPNFEEHYSGHLIEFLKHSMHHLLNTSNLITTPSQKHHKLVNFNPKTR
ncbi:hypothetical protein HanIR_Chr11g0522861 [Helianthus annuus]|nr:hypothetical protein HanIR_Chr11g0522861 [Helianthus annuus]